MRRRRPAPPEADGGGAGAAPPGYLDHACLGPPSRRTTEAVAGAVAALAEGPASATETSTGWLDRAALARGAVARLFGTRAADITLVENTTAGLAAVLTALPWRPADAVVVADREFVGAMAVGRWLARARSLELRVAAGPLPGQVAAQVDRRARAVLVSSVAEVSGARADLAGLAEVCRPFGCALVVDGAQEAGVLTRDLPRCGADAYAAGGHKWLRSPFGTGLLWTSPPLRDRLVPGARGYLALDDPSGGWGAYLARPDRDAADPMRFRADGAALESGGTPNWLGATALHAAVGELLDAGPRVVESRAVALAGRLRDGLAERGLADSLMDPSGTSTLVSVALDGHAEAVEAVLSAHGVRASVRGAGGHRVLRVSCHGWNRPEDVDRLLDAVDGGAVPLVPVARPQRSPSES